MASTRLTVSTFDLATNAPYPVTKLVSDIGLHCHNICHKKVCGKGRISVDDNVLLELSKGEFELKYQNFQLVNSVMTDRDGRE